MSFIKISLNENTEQIINVENIIQLIKGDELQLIKVEDHEEFKAIPCYSLFLKNYGPIKITENVYKQIENLLSIKKVVNE